MHTWACLLTNYPIQFICFENRQTDQKPVQILSTRPNQYYPHNQIQNCREPAQSGNTARFTVPLPSKREC